MSAKINVELRDQQRTRCEGWVSEDRPSGGRTQPSERPAGTPGRTPTPGMGDKIELSDEERTRCEVWVREDRPSGGRTQPSERPAGMPGRTLTPGMGDRIELGDAERTRCEIWTRVMGYHRPVSAWNPGKQAEHAERCYYAEPDTRNDTPQTNAGH